MNNFDLSLSLLFGFWFFFTVYLFYNLLFVFPSMIVYKTVNLNSFFL